MRRLTKPVGFAACLCFLALQWSGLHVHSDAEGLVGTPETAHSHSHGHHDQQDEHAADRHDGEHDYADATDVSLTDPALGAFKVPAVILALVVLFALFPRVRTLASAEIAYPVLSGRHTRWRPPLRAPPLTA